ncbi:MAG: isocitrate lyase/PEP mutase family protein [Methylobacteriaceae bacterium]|nr:isocitrate lyase/PEP mutase family protein [Methylobacteriaceae bacterium]
MLTARPTSLRARLDAGEFIVAPGVFDMISARIADTMGFQALYMTGYGTVASHLGLPDAGLATFSDMLGRVERICSLTDTPLIADADTGYGGLLNVRHTVRAYEAAGAQAIQLEDQEFPKKCGHTPGRRVVAAAEMARKIAVAAESRRSDDFLIIARTDARASLGLDEALARAESYRRAGADILFVEAPESEAEMARIGASLEGPLLANLVEGGRTPIVSRERLREFGFAIAIHPAAGFLAAAAALKGIYGGLRQRGSSLGSEVPLLPFTEMNQIMGFEDVWAFEQAHADEP